MPSQCVMKVIPAPSGGEGSQLGALDEQRARGSLARALTLGSTLLHHTLDQAEEGSKGLVEEGGRVLGAERGGHQIVLYTIGPDEVEEEEDGVERVQDEDEDDGEGELTERRELSPSEAGSA